MFKASLLGASNYYKVRTAVGPLVSVVEKQPQNPRDPILQKVSLKSVCWVTFFSPGAGLHTALSY